MDLTQKLAILADAAKYDASCSSSGTNSKKAEKGGKGIGSTTSGSGICHSYTPDGRCISLLKILFTNHCIFDCKYCVNRVSSATPRASFTVDEVVKLTLDFYRRNYIEGLFLSSGIIRDSNYTMEQIVAVAKALRVTHGFRGYIHLKTIPGADDALIEQAGLYADRMSINIELPTVLDLKDLAPEKDRALLEGNMAKVEAKSQEYKRDRKAGIKSVPTFTPAGQSTQMIIGATPTADRAILATTHQLYSQHKLRRVYYSAYSPIPHADATLPGQSPPLWREHRLYQADWMLRFYGYGVEDITPEDAPELPLDIDPKTAWALRNRWFFPIDINRASKEQLLRIPGIGHGTVGKILSIRRYKSLRLEDLKTLKVALNRARHFIIAQNYQPDTALLDSPGLITRFSNRTQQLDLFST